MQISRAPGNLFFASRAPGTTALAFRTKAAGAAFRVAAQKMAKDVCEGIIYMFNRVHTFALMPWAPFNPLRTGSRLGADLAPPTFATQFSGLRGATGIFGSRNDLGVPCRPHTSTAALGT